MVTKVLALRHKVLLDLRVLPDRLERPQVTKVRGPRLKVRLVLRVRLDV